MSWAAFPFDPQRTPRRPVMALEATQSDALQQLGVSYSQLIDYSSKQYVATLVGPAPRLQITHSDRLRFKSVLWYCLHGTASPPCMRPLASRLNIVDTRHSDDEVAFFWQAERRSRWSLARILFMMVGSSTC